MTALEDAVDEAAHGPAAHGPAAHRPAAHGPAAHGPAAHGPAAHGPAANTYHTLQFDDLLEDLVAAELTGECERCQLLLVHQLHVSLLGVVLHCVAEHALPTHTRSLATHLTIGNTIE